MTHGTNDRSQTGTYENTGYELKIKGAITLPFIVSYSTDNAITLGKYDNILMALLWYDIMVSR